MKRLRGGYTIIEVLIVLGVSGVLLTAAILTYSNSQNGDRFNQSMHDVESKVQSYVNEVSNSVAPYDSTKDSCTMVGSHPKVVAVLPQPGSDQTCVFVGRAIQFLPASSHQLYAYAVFGCRFAQCSAGNAPAASLSEAGLAPIMPNQNGSIDLTDKYLTNPDISLKSPPTVTYAAGGTASLPATGLVGLYNDFASTGTQSVSLKAQAYNCGQTSDCSVGSAGLRDCLEQVSSDCASPAGITKIQACFISALTKQTALLTININSATIGTELNLVNC